VIEKATATSYVVGKELGCPETHSKAGSKEQ
jgi:hypothetical protein